MARTVSLNGTNYSVPEPGDTGYAQTLSSYLLALATAFPQLSNSVQQALGAELDLGALFGIKSLYFKTQTANPASAGLARLAKTDSISWRNNANTADLLLGISGSDVLQFNGASFLSVPLAAEADFGATAGIKAAYLKSRAATIAAAGVLRLAGTATADTISWRNNGNTADLPLTVNASDQLLFNGAIVTTGGGTPNPLIAPSTASLGLEGNVADGATAIGVKIGNFNALANAAAKIVSFYNDALATEKAYINKDGTLAADQHKAFTATSLTLMGAVADGATAVGVISDNVNDLTNATAKLHSFRRAGVEKAYIDKDGNLSTAAAANPWTSVFVTADQTLTAAATVDVTGMSFAMVAGTYVIRGSMFVSCADTTSTCNLRMKAAGAPTTSFIGIAAFFDQAASAMQAGAAAATGANFEGASITVNQDAGENWRIFSGTIKATGAGTFQLTATQAGASAFTLHAGSHLEYRKVA